MNPALNRRRQRTGATATRLFVLGLCLSWLPLGAAGSSDHFAEALPAELAWVGLFNGAVFGWVNNSNRIVELCEEHIGTASEYACREVHMAPRAWVIPVRAAPASDGTRLGEVLLMAVPGKPLQIHLSTQGLAQPFTPDLFLADWGYGPPYFHMTILARDDSWFRVPLPEIGPAWVNSDDWIDDWQREVHVERLQADDRVITTPHGDMVLLAVEEDALLVRPEQEPDMWCQAGQPPPLETGTEMRIPFRELFDESGRLLVGYKYMKGC